MTRVALGAAPRDVGAVGDAEYRERGRVQPYRVLVVGGHEDRAVGQPVEVGGVGPAAFDHGVHRVLRADPVEIGSAGSELADATAHLSDLVYAL